MVALWIAQLFLFLSVLGFLCSVLTDAFLLPQDALTPDVDTLEEVAGIRELHIPVSTDVYPGHELQETDLSRHKRSVSKESVHQRVTGRQYAGLSGDVVFSARRAFRLYFRFDYSALSLAEILSAHVVIYQTRPRRMRRRTRKARSVSSNPEVAGAESGEATRGRQQRDAKGRDGDKVKGTSARVIMHQTIDYGVDVGTTRPTDMKLVNARSRGWKAFDIGPAVTDWVTDPTSNQGLELWVMSTHMGRRAARTALCMKFVKPNSHRAIFRPELIVKLKPANPVSEHLNQ